MSRDEKNFERKPICFQHTVGRNLIFKYATVRVQKKLRNMLLQTKGGRFLLQGDKKLSKIISWSYVQENT